MPVPALTDRALVPQHRRPPAQQAMCGSWRTCCTVQWRCQRWRGAACGLRANAVRTDPQAVRPSDIAWEQSPGADRRCHRFGPANHHLRPRPCPATCRPGWTSKSARYSIKRAARRAGFNRTATAAAAGHQPAPDPLPHRAPEHRRARTTRTRNEPDMRMTAAVHLCLGWRLEPPSHATWNRPTTVRARQRPAARVDLDRGALHQPAARGVWHGDAVQQPVH